MEDYYKILNIERSASQDEIKKSYRSLALKNHPDKGGDEETFKKISIAYECLSNTELRHKYDNPQPEFNGGNMQDIFEEFLNGHRHHQHQQRRVKRNNHMYKVNVSLKDIHNGITKTLKIKISKLCFSCVKICSNCNGNGIRIQSIQMGPFTQQIQVNCGCDNGTVKKQNVNCLNCNGTNIKNEEENIKIDIPKNTENGMNIVFKNLGEQCKKENEDAGDLIIIINIENDQYFTRENNNLIYKSKMSFGETLFGKDIIIPHFDENISINTSQFGIIEPNKRYIIKNKGLGNVGNLILVFDVSYPEKVLTIEEKQIFVDMFKSLEL